MPHSPLPWTKKSEFTEHWFIRDANGETIVLIAQTKQQPEPSDDPAITLTRTVKLPHADSNAALFLAAPKLLAAAKAIAGEWFFEGDDDCTMDISVIRGDLRRLLAAIAEAEAS